MRPRKPPYGQHFLHDGNLLSAIVRDAELAPGTAVLEIGCGAGALTAPLLSAGVSLTGVEVDRRLLPGLAERFGANPAFRLVPGDILELDWEGLLAPGRGTVVMGNLPYSVSTEVLFRVLRHRARIIRAVFLVQYEVGRRVCARPGNKDFGIISIACQLFGATRLLRKVPPSVFTPPPKVDSAVFRWDVSPECLFPARDPDFTMRAVKASFGHRRKTLANGLTDGGIVAKDRALELLREMGLSPTVRAEQLSIAQWVELSNLIANERETV